MDKFYQNETISFILKRANFEELFLKSKENNLKYGKTINKSRNKYTLNKKENNLENKKDKNRISNTNNNQKKRYLISNKTNISQNDNQKESTFNSNKKNINKIINKKNSPNIRYANYNKPKRDIILNEKKQIKTEIIAEEKIINKNGNKNISQKKKLLKYNNEKIGKNPVGDDIREKNSIINRKNKNIKKKKEENKKVKELKQSKNINNRKILSSLSSEKKSDLNKTLDLKKYTETIPTTLDTLSPEKETKKEKEKKIEISNENIPVFARIPRLIRRQSRIATNTTFNAKDVEKAIKLRRNQYNEYIKSLNKPKPQIILKLEPEPIPEPIPEPEEEPETIVYDNNKVNIIQKVFKGYQIKEIYQTVTRLKIKTCITELLCLILSRIYIHAKKRISFSILKTYFHVPFSNISKEIDFKDKIAMKLSDRYYNFNNLIEYEYYEL